MENNTIRALEPSKVFGFFVDLTQIPRGSGNERAVGDYLLRLGQERGLITERDACGNVLLVLPASPGKEGAPKLALQGHMDMVCAKDASVNFDFTTMPIEAYSDGEFIRARGTTLGADDGIGVALSLAVLDEMLADPALPHGEVRCIYTAGEEDGMTGAQQLDPEWLHVDYLIGLDYSDPSTVLVSCAGFEKMHAAADFTAAPANEKMRRLCIRLSGLTGGHSGNQIHKKRGNAIQWLAELLRGIGVETNARLLRLDGGTAINVIPRECEAELLVPAGYSLSGVQSWLEEKRENESTIQLTVSEIDDAAQEALSESDTARIFRFLTGLPNGCLLTVPDGSRADLSANLGQVSLSNGKFAAELSTRSNINREFDRLEAQIFDLGRELGVSVERVTRSDVWEDGGDYPLLQIVQACARELGRDMKTRSIHAGTEEGIFAGRAAIKGYRPQMVNLGAATLEMHTPRERLEIASVGRAFTLLQSVVKRILLD